MVRPQQLLHPQREPAATRPAATVLLLRDSAQGIEVLMTRRSLTASFAPGAYVFPGGGIDALDAASHAQALRRPTQSDLHLTQAIAAIRESFEELGILLAYRADHSMATAQDIALLDRSQPFAAQCTALGLKLAADQQLPADFITWLATENDFCNSLVDRIVPGAPDTETAASICAEVGYEDKNIIVSEVYRLWAIQGGSRVKEVLSFAKADAGVVIAEDIEIYRELKLRLLNGTHSLMCGMSYLLGFRLVKDAMANNYLSKLVMNLMLSELALAIPYKMDFKVADRFGRAVLDRFKNPFINHKLIDITVQYTTKMRMRNIPLLVNYYKEFGKAPELFAMGFAAYLQFMHAVKEENGKYFGDSNGELYPINCDHAGYFYEAWKDFNLNQVLADKSLWGEDLSALPGFEAAVQKYI